MLAKNNMPNEQIASMLLLGVLLFCRDAPVSLLARWGISDMPVRTCLVKCWMYSVVQRAAKILTIIVIRIRYFVTKVLRT